MILGIACFILGLSSLILGQARFILGLTGLVLGHPCFIGLVTCLVLFFLFLIVGKTGLVLVKTGFIGLHYLSQTGFLCLNQGLSCLDFGHGIGVFTLKNQLVNLFFQGLFGRLELDLSLCNLGGSQVKLVILSL